MKRPRDSQRSRCYKWENTELKTAWLVIDKDNTPLGEIGARHLAQRVWEELQLPGLTPLVRVMGNRGRGTSRPGIILLSSSYQTTQTTWYILHELSHAILSSRRDIAYHGPEFCDLYARLLDKYTAARYADVIESMKEAGLKTRNLANPLLR